MITKFNLFENHEDVDPYGEEDWGESSPEMERLWNIILGCEIFINKNFNREDGSIEFDCYYPRRDGRLEFLIEEIEGEITMNVSNRREEYSVVLREFTPLRFLDAFADLAEQIRPLE